MLSTLMLTVCQVFSCYSHLNYIHQKRKKGKRKTCLKPLKVNLEYKTQVDPFLCLSECIYLETQMHAEQHVETQMHATGRSTNTSCTEQDLIRIAPAFVVLLKAAAGWKSGCWQSPLQQIQWIYPVCWQNAHNFRWNLKRKGKWTLSLPCLVTA